jgi:hypothetical protein
MYVTHRQVATTAFLLIFVHVLTVPISVTGWKLGNYLAVIAFTGIVSIVLISLAPRIAFLNRLTGGTYEGWKNLKKYIGIFFILAFFHSLTIGNPLHAFIAINWVQLFFILGAVSYLYTEVFGRFFKKYVRYTVEAVRHPNASTTEVTLRAKNQPIKKQRILHSRAIFEITGRHQRNRGRRVRHVRLQERQAKPDLDCRRNRADSVPILYPRYEWKSHSQCGFLLHGSPPRGSIVCE